MDAELTAKIRAISWDGLTVAEAREIYAALREGVAQGAEWFRSFAKAFATESKSVPEVDRAGVSPSVPTATTIPSRGRGRPRKTPLPSAVRHPPISAGTLIPDVGVVPQGFTVSHQPPPANGALPPGHPRSIASHPTSVESGLSDPDTALIERTGGKNVFN